MPAGTCPGQFDLEPQQVRRVRTAVLVIRHDMQGFLDARFAAAGVPLLMLPWLAKVMARNTGLLA